MNYQIKNSKEFYPYILDNDVTLVKYQILVDEEKTFLQVSLYNSGKDTIMLCIGKAVCYDENNAIIDNNIEIIISNVKVKPHYCFGSEILTQLPNNVTSLNITLNKAISVEGKELVVNSTNEILPKKSEKMTQLFDSVASTKTIRHFFGDKVDSNDVITSYRDKSFPVFWSEYWQCSCSKVNKLDDEFCPLCGELQLLASKFDRKSMEKKSLEFEKEIELEEKIKKEQEEKIEQERIQKEIEEQERKKQEQKEKDDNTISLITATISEIKSTESLSIKNKTLRRNVASSISLYNGSDDYVKENLNDFDVVVDANKKFKQIKKTQNIIFGSSTGASVVAIFLVFLFFLIIPTNNYNKAKELYQAGDYIKAQEIFESLKNFKDSKILAELSGAKGLQFTLLEDNTYAVSGYIGNETDIIIPTTINNVPITAIDDKVFYECSANTIALPDSITSIGESAFYGCVNLIAINIPSGVTKIENDTFNGCYKLKTVTIPDTVTSIGDNAFLGADLSNVILPANLTYLGKASFKNNANLSTINIPSSITQINDETFYGCSSLTKISLPISINAINENAFFGCTLLNSINVPSNVTTIGSGAFYGCKNMTSFNLSNVTTLGEKVFFDCIRLTSVTLSSALTSIPNYTFTNCKVLTNFVLPKTVSNIGDSAFENCAKLNNLPLTYVRTLGVACFKNCQSITEITLPGPITIIPDSAFYGCSALKNFALTTSLKSIGDYAFYGCVELLTFESSTLIQLNNIGSNAFYGCAKMLIFKIASTVTNIGSKAFYNCNILNVYCTAKSKLSTWATDWTNLLNRVYYSSQTGADKQINIEQIIINDLFYKLVGNEARLSKCYASGAVVIPESIDFGSSSSTFNVTAILENAFSNCVSVSSVSIPSTIKSIGLRAFYGCTGLKSINIPKSVTSVGEDAFFGCSNASLMIKCQSSSKPATWSATWAGNVPSAKISWGK